VGAADAVALSYDEATGHEWILIHVADPSRWVLKDSALDRLAQERMASIYLPELLSPMLPTQVATDAVSLFQDRHNLALTFAVRLAAPAAAASLPDAPDDAADASLDTATAPRTRATAPGEVCGGAEGGALQEYRIFPAELPRVRQCTYAQVDRLLAAQPGSSSALAAARVQGANSSDGQTRARIPGDEIFEGEDGRVRGGSLQRLHYLARLRQRYRASQGALDFGIPRPKISLTVGEEAQGEHRLDVRRWSEEGSASRALVQEMMLLAGEAAARFAQECKMPFLYRAQIAGARIPPSLALDSPAGAGAGPAAVQEGVGEGSEGGQVPAHIAEVCRHFQQLMLMKPAVSLVLPAPHGGLGLKAYSQVTSPIRRYADLLLHRQLKAALLQHPWPYSHHNFLEMLPKIDQVLCACAASYCQDGGSRPLRAFAHFRCEEPPRSQPLNPEFGMNLNPKHYL